MLALVLGSIAALWLSRHVHELAGVLALPLPTAIAAAGGDAGRRDGPDPARARRLRRVDVPLQKRLHGERLKMSHQELKQEQKELDGNAEVKGKVRARMREMTKRRMMTAVPKADLVVMNPTHYAVALKYDDKTMGAPRVVAKGADLLALRIRDLAQGASVPVLRGAGAGARALRPRRARPRDPGGAVRRGRAGARLRLPAARGAARPGRDAGRAAGARRAGRARPARTALAALH